MLALLRIAMLQIVSSACLECSTATSSRILSYTERLPLLLGYKHDAVNMFFPYQLIVISLPHFSLCFLFAMIHRSVAHSLYEAL